MFSVRQRRALFVHYAGFYPDSLPSTLHPTPYTLHLTPSTLHPTPYTLLGLVNLKIYQPYILRVLRDLTDLRDLRVFIVLILLKVLIILILMQTRINGIFICSVQNNSLPLQSDCKNPTILTYYHSVCYCSICVEK